MEPGAINSFLDQFIALADGGFGLIQGDVTFVLNALIAISIVLAGAQWALGGDAPLAPFFRKVLFIGFFAFLINNWEMLSTVIHRTGAMMGVRAGGDGLSVEDLHNPGRVAGIGNELFGRTVETAEGMNLLFDTVPLLTIYIGAMFVALGFFFLALQIFIALIAFKLGSLAAFVALPWGVFAGTAWVAERPLGWVAGSAMRLFVLAFIASVSIAFVNTLPPMLTLDEGAALNVLLFGLTVLGLSWFGPQLASEVVQGNPNLSGSDWMRSASVVGMQAAGAGFMAAGAVGAASKVLGGAARAGARRSRGGSPGGAGNGAPPKPSPSGAAPFGQVVRAHGASGGQEPASPPQPNYRRMIPKPAARALPPPPRALPPPSGGSS